MMKQFNNKKKVVILFLVLLTVEVFSQTPKHYFKVEKTGKGTQNVIFIPGFACSGDVWKETRTIFEQEFTCYTITLAGFAGVQPLKEPVCFIDYSKAIAQYIKANQIESPILIGHSLGGGLALEIASEFPDLIDKIVVVDALPCLSAMMNPNFKTNPNIDCSKTVGYIQNLSEAKFSEMQKIAIASLVANKEKQENVLNWSLQSDRATFGKIFCDFSNTDLRPKLKNIKCKTLVLLESYFKNFTSVIKNQYKDLKNVKLAYANNGLHFIMYDDKDWYLQQLKSFLSE